MPNFKNLLGTIIGRNAPQSITRDNELPSEIKVAQNVLSQLPNQVCKPETASQQEALEYWHELKAEAVLPQRKQLDLLRLVRVMPNIALFDIYDDPFDVSYRLMGETVLHHFTENYTNRRLSNIPGKGEGSIVFENFKRICDTKIPTTTAVPYSGPYNEFKRVSSLALPFTKDTGNVEQVFMIVEFLTVDQI